MGSGIGGGAIRPCPRTSGPGIYRLNHSRTAGLRHVPWRMASSETGGRSRDWAANDRSPDPQPPPLAGIRRRRSAQRCQAGKPVWTVVPSKDHLPRRPYQTVAAEGRRLFHQYPHFAGFAGSRRPQSCASGRSFRTATPSKNGETVQGLDPFRSRLAAGRPLKWPRTIFTKRSSYRPGSRQSSDHQAFSCERPLEGRRPVDQRCISGSVARGRRAPRWCPVTSVVELASVVAAGPDQLRVDLGEASRRCRPRCGCSPPCCAVPARRVPPELSDGGGRADSAILGRRRGIVGGGGDLAVVPAPILQAHHPRPVVREAGPPQPCGLLAAAGTTPRHCCSKLHQRQRAA